MRVTSRLPSSYSNSWGVGVQPYARPPGSQRNQQSGLRQSSCVLPSPGNAWLGLAPLLARMSGPLKCLLPSSLPSDRPSPARAFELGSFLLLSVRTPRSLPVSPPFLPLTNAFGATFGPRFQVSQGHQLLSSEQKKQGARRSGRAKSEVSDEQVRLVSQVVVQPLRHPGLRARGWYPPAGYQLPFGSPEKLASG